MSMTTSPEPAPVAVPVRRADGGPPLHVDPRRHATTWLWEGPDGGGDVLRHWDGGSSSWQGVGRPQLAARVLSLAAGLVAMGVGTGDSVVLMGRTRLEWTVSDLAILTAGAVVVPVYETATVEQCRYILASSRASLAIADLACRARLEEAWRGAGEVVTMDGSGMEALAAGGREGDAAEVRRRLDGLDGASLATIIYTSGTTGVPKGCRLTHGNIVWTSAQARARLGGALEDGASTLLFLPLAHVFARVVQFVCLEAGVPVGYARSLAQVADDLASFRPTLVLAVPAVLQRVFDRARSQATGRLKAGIFGFAVRTAEACSRTTTAGTRHRSLVARRTVADRLVYARVRHGFGGRLRYCVSGGAPLPVELARFFQTAGVTVLEGYGLTETSAPVSVNVPGDVRLGTVGRPLPGVSVRLADDGEILVRGGNVFAGYHEDEVSTAGAVEGGWLRTGDLGRIDGDGFLTVTGRKKDLIVMSTGKKVAPGPLEERLRARRLVADAVVVGDDRPFVVALIALEAGAAPRAGSRDEARVRAEVQRAVDYANTGLSRAEAIRAFAILDRGLTQEQGELTPTLKVCRGVVAEHFAGVIASMYASPAGAQPEASR